MSNDMKARLETQLADVVKEFDANAARIKTLAKDRAVIDRQLSVLQARQSELRGENAGLKKLLLDPVKDIPVEGPTPKKVKASKEAK